ncbi:MAG: protein kinase [Pirellulaceae bacterium]|nr:protein kinase [Pirellulaceae bacterium]
MQHDPSWHPDPHVLVAFDSGTLGEAESSVVEDHLGRCAQCVARLLDGADDSLVARLREVHASPPCDTAVTSQADTSGCAVPGSDCTLHRHPSALVPHRDDIAPVSGSVARFTLLARIGAGGFGIVYKAYDPDLDRHVAIKVPHEGILRTPRHRERFLREARAAATLSHPNICPVHEVGHWNNLPYIVMPVLEGATLDRLLDSDQRPTTQQAVRWVRSVAETLEYAHSKGVVHRDLKPSNILINERGEPIVMDFGLAWRQTDQGTRLTGDLEMMGTPLYMSPEQTRGNAATTSPATDIYSLGVVLYELLTGQPPFQGGLGELIGQILHVEPRPPAELNRQVPTELNAVCMRCLAKDPAARFPSMDALAHALGDCLTGPVLPPPDLNAGVGDPVSGMISPDPSVEAVAPDACQEPPAGATVMRRARRSRRTVGIAASVAGLTIAAVVVVRLLTDQGEIESRSFDPKQQGEIIQHPPGEGQEHANARKTAADLLARCLELGRSGDFSEVVEVASDAIRIEPECAEAYEMRARAYAELGNYAAAVTDCDTALQLDPQLVPAYVTSAQANVALGRLSEAIRAADAGLARDANSIPCYANRGMARAKQAQLQEALADFDAIVERAPGDATAGGHGYLSQSGYIGKRLCSTAR